MQMIPLLRQGRDLQRPEHLRAQQHAGDQRHQRLGDRQPAQDPGQRDHDDREHAAGQQQHVDQAEFEHAVVSRTRSGKGPPNPRTTRSSEAFSGTLSSSDPTGSRCTATAGTTLSRPAQH